MRIIVNPFAFSAFKFNHAVLGHIVDYLLVNTLLIYYILCHKSSGI